MSCSKSGIKIHNTNNNKQICNEKTYIDLNIENYSLQDLYKLFGIQGSELTDEIMREAKKIVLKTHPDKSFLEPKYFLFYSNAYKRLYGIYNFQNKSIKKIQDNNDYYDSDNIFALDNMFEKNKHLKNSNNFNKWFNDQFDKYKLEDESNQTGYGDWLKSEENILNLGNISKQDMDNEFEKQKKHVQSLNVYKGINEISAPILGGSTLISNNNNYTSDNLFSNEGMGYTDLKQAYIESIIPVTKEDYKNTLKFKNVEEYKYYRNTVDTTPIQEKDALNQLYNKSKHLDEESSALAFYYAKQSEQAKQNNNNFWANLKQLEN
jgi:hypothetical protein